MKTKRDQSASNAIAVENAVPGSILLSQPDGNEFTAFEWPADAVVDCLADCYVFLLRQRYERLAETKQYGEQVEDDVKGPAMGIPTVPTPSKN